MNKTKILLFIVMGLNLLAIAKFGYDKFIFNEKTSYVPSEEKSVVANISPVASVGNDKWTRCIRTHDGTIHFRGHFMSFDGGKTIGSEKNINLEEINAEPERATISLKGLFYAIGGAARLVSPGVYSVTTWRSTDELKTINHEKAIVYVPEGPTRVPQKGEWYGLYVYLTILEMPDGTWLMTMYGNFNTDNLPPQDSDAQKETAFMARTFIVTSTDKGHSWHFLSSVAIPKRGDPIGEGFVEPAIVRLDDGRLLCVMRSGHHFPLYASWSADGGRTWTCPLYTGIDRACDPCLIKLRDGRIALSWGRRYSEGWSKVTPEGDQATFKYPGEGYTNLALSLDGGASWVNNIIAKQTGSCYSMIFEVEPNVVFIQVDKWYWRVTLKPRNQF
jgi:hypothetical protein